MFVPSFPIVDKISLEMRPRRCGVLSCHARHTVRYHTTLHYTYSCRGKNNTTSCHSCTAAVFSATTAPNFCSLRTSAMQHLTDSVQLSYFCYSTATFCYATRYYTVQYLLLYCSVVAEHLLLLVHTVKHSVAHTAVVLQSSTLPCYNTTSINRSINVTFWRMCSMTVSTTRGRSACPNTRTIASKWMLPTNPRATAYVLTKATTATTIPLPRPRQAKTKRRDERKKSEKR